MRLTSTAGYCEVVVTCRTLLAAVPTSTEIVPELVIGPPESPVPALTDTTEPTAPDIGSHRAVEEFHPSTWPPFGAAFETLSVCNFTALMLEMRLPSTAGYCASGVICKI